jgi:hypothetical protein
LLTCIYLLRQIVLSSIGTWRCNMIELSGMWTEAAPY